MHVFSLSVEETVYFYRPCKQPVSAETDNGKQMIKMVTKVFVYVFQLLNSNLILDEYVSEHLIT